MRSQLPVLLFIMADTCDASSLFTYCSHLLDDCCRFGLLLEGAHHRARSPPPLGQLLCCRSPERVPWDEVYLRSENIDGNE